MRERWTRVLLNMMRLDSSSSFSGVEKMPIAGAVTPMTLTVFTIVRNRVNLTIARPIGRFVSDDVCFFV